MPSGHTPTLPVSWLIAAECLGAASEASLGYILPVVIGDAAVGDAAAGKIQNAGVIFFSAYTHALRLYSTLPVP